MGEKELAERKIAIHLLRQGSKPVEVAKELGRCQAWVYKWRKRYFQHPDWQTLADQSHAPHHLPKKMPDEVRQAIRITRSELEGEAKQPGKLSYHGAHAVQARLRQKGVDPLPSISSIERELRAAQLTRRQRAVEAAVNYPQLQPLRSLQLVQIDIVPHYLPGGACVACFNAIDVVSHFPTGRQSLTKHSEDAQAFLIHVWQEIGLAEYTQVDNESCFSGGFTHSGVLGKVLRLALFVGTQLVFSPIRHPESNGTVERFHQDYSKNVWDKISLPNLETVQARSPEFFASYRLSGHHSALHGHAPIDLHPAGCRLPANLSLPERLPLTVGQVHFIRRVNPSQQVLVLNLHWDLPNAQPDQGVWATLDFTLHGASLLIFDAAPDVRERVLLAQYPFPLKEEVQPLSKSFCRPIPVEFPGSFQSSIEPIFYHVFGLVSTML
jgi:hypothetical protein